MEFAILSTHSISADDHAWLAHCSAQGLNPATRLQAREAVLANANSLECCLYRPNEDDPDAEELDLGDAIVLLQGAFQAPAEWDADARADYFDDSDPADFFAAVLETCAAPGSRQHIQPRAGDYLAVSQADGQVQMYYLYECLEEDDGSHCVLILEDNEL